MNKPPDAIEELLSAFDSLYKYVNDDGAYSRPNRARLVLETWLRDQLAADPAGQWQPIETAPKDDAVVLLWEDDCVWIGSYVDFERVGGAPEGYHSGWFDDVTGRNEIKPTHWMPLPTAPRATGEGARDGIEDRSERVDSVGRGGDAADADRPADRGSDDRRGASDCGPESQADAAPVAVSLDPHRLLDAASSVVQLWQEVVVPVTAPGVHRFQRAIAELDFELARLRGEATVRQEPLKCRNGNDCQNPAVREFCYAADPWTPYCAAHRPQYETAGDRPLRGKNAAR